MNWSKCWCELYYIGCIILTMPIRNNLSALKKDDMNLHLACDLIEERCFWPWW